MPDMPWMEAILQVMRATGTPMHYTAIADAVAKQGLRESLGATPASTVNAFISGSIATDTHASVFLRVGRGMYALRQPGQTAPAVASAAEVEAVEETGLINAFGMYWARAAVRWEVGKPKLLGQQPTSSVPVDFYDQRGVYLLHDGRSVVYVGRAIDRAIGARLKDHTVDRLNGRWDRFSWFGVYSATDTGSLNTATAGTFDISMLIVTMEALLIEGLEPPQNRKRGDDFQAVEFLQRTDAEIQKSQALQLINTLLSKAPTSNDS